MPVLPTYRGMAKKKFSVLPTGNNTAPVYNTTSGQFDFASVPIIKRVSFTEDGSGTSYTGAVAIPAGSHLADIYVWSTALWDGTSASFDCGDTADPNGYFAAVNLKATDLLVGQMLQMSNSSYWGGKNGAYLVAATGTRTPVYYAAADTITGLVTPGAADGSAGRSFMDVTYWSPVATASVNV